MTLKRILITITIFNFVAASTNYNPLEIFSREKKYPTCKKEKVVNKVPVQKLCEYDDIKWEGLICNRFDVSICNLHGAVGGYVPEVNIPQKFQVANGRVYFSIERHRGVCSTLNYFDLVDINNAKCPLAKCYPNCVVNQFASPLCNLNTEYLTNVLDFEVDNCNVLWAFDAGHYHNCDRTFSIFVQKPKLCAINVTTNEFIKCYILPSEVNYPDTILGFNNILVNTRGGCAKTFVYLFNALTGTLVVFSLQTASFWIFRSIWLNPNPDFIVFNTRLPDYRHHEYVGLNGVAAVLGTHGITFGPRGGVTLYFASYDFVHNPENIYLDELKFDITILGTLNENGQTSTLSRYNDTVFGVQELQSAIVCYNRRSDINEEAIQLLVKDRHKYVFIVDMSLNTENNRSPILYFLSSNLIENKYDWFHQDESKFQFYYIDVNKALLLYPDCKGYYKDMTKKVYNPQYTKSDYSNSDDYKKPPYHDLKQIFEQSKYLNTDTYKKTSCRPIAYGNAKPSKYVHYPR